MTVNTEVKEELTKLHEKHMEDMDQNELFQYLLDCQEMIRTWDIIGWKKKFQPQETVIQPMKKRKMTHHSIIWKNHEKCTYCGSDETIEDVNKENVVCTMCGTIQYSCLNMCVADTSADVLTRASPVVVHRYSRIVYFRSFILSLVAQTEPIISEETKLTLRREIDGKITIPKLKSVLKKHNLLTKYRRHLNSIRWDLDPSYRPMIIEGDTLRLICSLFRRIEFFWELKGHKRSFKNRRVFLSYPYVFFQICHHIGRPDLTGEHHLLKSPKLLKKLHTSYEYIAADAGLTCKTDIYRNIKKPKM